MESVHCEDCYDECYWVETCPECKGDGLFIGSGIDDVMEPHFYNMEHPSQLPCIVCNGETVITVYCPEYAL